MQSALSSMDFLSPHGRCFSFDQSGNGYGRGEGVAMVVLKNLDDALRDQDTIRAVIRSTGLGQDGRTPAVTQPSGQAQKNLIQSTYRKANLDLATTRFVEAHGTGTPTGDPIEANAIGEVFQKYRNENEPLFVGTVKSNIGHLEGASGIAGLIKAILVLEHGIIPPNADLQEINHKINCESPRLCVGSRSRSYPSCVYINANHSLKLPRHPVPWPVQGLRRASVSLTDIKLSWNGVADRAVHRSTRSDSAVLMSKKYSMMHFIL